MLPDLQLKYVSSSISTFLKIIKLQLFLPLKGLNYWLFLIFAGHLIRFNYKYIFLSIVY